MIQIDLSKKLGYSFKNTELLKEALTHPSFGGDHSVPNYQRLEFLGDAVLELSVSRYLYLTHPGMDEGPLTRARAALVREEALARVAGELGLGDIIRMSVGEDRSGGRSKPSILSDVTEALLGAIFLDSDFEHASAIVERLICAKADEYARNPMDAKSRLQEILQKTGMHPEYEQLYVEGPPHAPVFHYQVSEHGEPLGQGVGASKQAAQQAAASDALVKLGMGE